LKMSVKPSMAIASESECLFMIFTDCIVLIRIEDELFMPHEMNENHFCSRQRKNLSTSHGWTDDVVTIFSPTAGTNATLRTLI
jgi:hypothetical protein